MSNATSLDSPAKGTALGASSAGSGKRDRGFMWSRRERPYLPPGIRGVLKEFVRNLACRFSGHVQGIVRTHTLHVDFPGTQGHILLWPIADTFCLRCGQMYEIRDKRIPPPEFLASRAARVSASGPPEGLEKI